MSYCAPEQHLALQMLLIVCRMDEVCNTIRLLRVYITQDEYFLARKMRHILGF